MQILFKDKEDKTKCKPYFFKEDGTKSKSYSIKRGQDKMQNAKYFSFKTKFAEAYLGRMEKRDWQGKASRQ